VDGKMWQVASYRSTEALPLPLKAGKKCGKGYGYQKKIREREKNRDLDPCLKINKQCTHKNRDKEPNQTGGQAIKSFDLRKTQKSRRAGKI